MSSAAGPYARIALLSSIEIMAHPLATPLHPLRTSICLLYLLCAGNGCGIFYERRCSGETFVIYSDRSKDFVEKAAAKAARIYQGFEELFDVGEKQIGRVSIFLEGSETDVCDRRSAPDILGYYVPFLRYISVDTAPCGEDESLLDQVLLHEISHHFIATEWSGASSECWLNEGLAGALEVSVFDDRRFEHPLVNPLLFPIAQNAAYERDRDVALRDLLGMSWGEFHNREHKERNYALAWSAVYFLLERHLPKSEPIGRRIERLYTMDREVIAGLDAEWYGFLRGFDLSGHLLKLAEDSTGARPLTALWATRQLGSAHIHDDLKVLKGLVGLFDSPDSLKRGQAYVSFLARAERARHSFCLADETVIEGFERIGFCLEDVSQPEPLREAVAIALGGSLKTRERWFQPLVALLGTDEGGLRAAAARTLSRLASKRTVVNPAFWRTAPPEARQREVEEWHDWLRGDDPGTTVIP